MSKIKGRVELQDQLPGVNWSVFTIAVQDPRIEDKITFPSKFMVEIYEKYHNTKNGHMPLVLTIGSLQNIKGVLPEAARWVFDVDHSSTKSPFDENKTPFGQLKNCASCFLTAANNANMFETNRDKCIERLRYALDAVHQVRKRAEYLHRNSEQPDSVFDAGYDNYVSKEENSSTMEHILWIIGRIKKQIDEAELGHILSKMSQEELTLALSHMELDGDSIFGKFFAKASKLRKAPPPNLFAESLKKFFNETLPNEKENGIHSCPVDGTTFKEMLYLSRHFLHLCTNTQDALLRIPCLGVVMSIRSFDGKTPGYRPAQLDIDSFACSGEFVSNSLRYVLSSDFFNDPEENKVNQVFVPLAHIHGSPVPKVDGKGRYTVNDQGEKVPRIVGKDCFYNTIAGKQMMSFCLLNNIHFHAMAGPGLMATALRAIYTMLRVEDGYIIPLLNLRQSILFTLDLLLHNGSQAMDGLLDYIEAAGDFSPESVAKCLTTESDMIAYHFKCPSFGKFLLALVQNVAEGNKPTLEQLRHIQLAWIVEACGRSGRVGKNLSKFVRCDETMTTDQILDAWDEAIDPRSGERRMDLILNTSFTKEQAVESYLDGVRALRADQLGLDGFSMVLQTVSEEGRVVGKEFVTMDREKIHVDYPDPQFHVSVVCMTLGPFGSCPCV